MHNVKEQRMHLVTVYILLWTAHFPLHFILNLGHQINFFLCLILLLWLTMATHDFIPK